MRKIETKAGLTLVEILVVVAIIIILAAIVVTVATRLNNQSKEQLTKGTFTIIDGALEQFKEHGFQYFGRYYNSFNFPIDCNGYGWNSPPYFNVRDTLIEAFDAVDVKLTSGTYDPNYSGISVMYLLLNQVPDCKKTLEKIDSSLVTNTDASGQNLNIEITYTGGGSKAFPLYRIIDAWKTPLQYDNYSEQWAHRTQTEFNKMQDSRKSFPVLISAGPDKIFGTPDDIKSRLNK
jgi:type II secretory pathway pseudopilin PulG